MGRHRAYSTARWNRIREKILSRQPLCEICLGNNKTTAADTVDHIVAHKGDESLLWDTANLRSLCHSCHSSKTARQDNDQAFGRWSRIPTWISQPLIPVTIVCGPPGSGKTTYAESHRAKDSLLIDLDYIAADLSGQNVHECDMKEWIGPAMRKRNEILASLGKPNARNYLEAWFVVQAPRLSDRRKWGNLLNAQKVIVMETDKQTCQERTAHRSKEVRQAVSTWWRQYTGDVFNECQVVSR